jgi:hypothetical protein
LVNSIRYQLKLKPIAGSLIKNTGENNEDEDNIIRYEWQEIIRVMNTQKVVTTTAQNLKDEIIIIRKCFLPNKKAKQIYDKLSYRYYPFKKKKFAVHKLLFDNTDFSLYQSLLI